MPISRAQIQNIKDFELRTILLGMYDQHLVVGGALGINVLEPTNSPQQPASAPPPLCVFSAVGKNGVVTVTITNPSQSINKTIYHEISYSSQASFVGGSGVTTLPISTSTHQTFQLPGVAAFWRLRSSYNQNNWNNYQIQPGTVNAGLQSSAASEAATVLNQTNYANVDSVAVGGTANVRVFGKAGPNTQFPSVKGAAETILPSATIINVPLSSQKVLGFNGANYEVRGTLPEVLQDGMTPIGGVSVVAGGGVVLPTVALVLDGSGHVIAWNVLTQGNGLTAPVGLAIVTSTGSGATPGAQTIVAGKLISIAPGNPGVSYAGGDTVTVSGGTFSGSTGGGQNIGGNGGRLIINDGTTG